MRSAILFTLPLLASVQAEEICKAITKTVTGDAIWVPTDAPGQHAWLPVDDSKGGWTKDPVDSHTGANNNDNGDDKAPHDGDQGNGWVNVPKPGGEDRGEDEPVKGGDKDDDEPVKGGDKAEHDGDWVNVPGVGDGDDGWYTHGPGKPTTTYKSSKPILSTTTTNGSKPSTTGPGQETTTSKATTSYTHGHGSSTSKPDEPSSTTKDGEHGSTTRDHSSSTNTPDEPSSTTKHGDTTSTTHERITSTTTHGPVTTPGDEGGIVCTATSTEVVIVHASTATTITPEPSTSVSTAYDTVLATITGPTKTLTFNTITTITETSTVMTTLEEIVTAFNVVMVTSPALTSTVPTPTGFLPIRSVYPEVAPTLRKRNETALISPQQVPANFLRIDDPALPHCTATTTVVVTSTNTVMSTGTITKDAVTVTETTTEKVTTTTTINPADASTTITDTTTEIATSVSATTTSTTVTSTTTSTEFTGPTPMVYAICSPENVLVNMELGQITAVGPMEGGLPLKTGPGSSAMDCCNKCAAMVNCATSAYYFNSCSFFETDTCNAAAPGAGFSAYELSSGFEISNGMCGQFTLASL